MFEGEIRRLIISTNIVDGSYEGIAKLVGVKENIAVLLCALDDGEEHSQTQICREWLIPKTTLNTIVKECIAAGWVTLVSRAHSAEKSVCLTEEGRAYAARVLRPISDAEERAYRRTIERYPPEFVAAYEAFANHLREEMKKQFISEVQS